MSLRKQSIGAARWSAISTLVVTGIQTVKLAALAAYLLPIDFGVAGLIIVITGFAATFADAGVSAAIIHRPDLSVEHRSSLYWLNLAVGVALWALLALAAPLFETVFAAPGLGVALPVMALLFPIAAIGAQFEVLFQKDLEFASLAKRDIAAALVGLAIALLLAYRGWGLWAVVWSGIAAAGAKSILLATSGVRRWPLQLRFRRSDVHAYVGFGAYQLGQRCANYINTRADQLVVGVLLGPEALGYYLFAWNIVGQPILRITPMVTKVAFPIFAKVQLEEERLRRGYLQVVRALLAINTPILLALVLLAPTVIPSVFGPKWVPSIHILQALGIYTLFRCASGPFNAILLARGRADLAFKWSMFSLLATWPVIILGVLVGGTIGVALSLGCYQIAVFVGQYVGYIRSTLPDTGRELFWAVTRPLLAGAVACAGAVLLAAVLPENGSLIGLVGSTLAGAALYAGVMLVADRESSRVMLGIVWPATGGTGRGGQCAV